MLKSNNCKLIFLPIFSLEYLLYRLVYNVKVFSLAIIYVFISNKIKKINLNKIAGYISINKIFYKYRKMFYMVYLD